MDLGSNFMRDTKASNGLAAKHVVDLLENGEPKVAVIGPMKSGSLILTSQIAPVYNVIQMSFVAVSAELRKFPMYPTLFRVNQDLGILNPLRAKLMKHFGWTRAGTLARSDDITLPQMEAFANLALNNKMTIAWSDSFTVLSELPDIIYKLKEKDVRIIFASFFHHDGAEVFCEAYKQGLYGPSYVWILTGSTLQGGWIRETQECSLEQVQAATNGHLVLLSQEASQSRYATISGRTAEEEFALLQRKFGFTSMGWSTLAPWVLDTMWTLALGLNNSMKFLAEEGNSLHNYNYSALFLNSILKGTREVSFSWFFDGKETPVLSYDMISDVLTWSVPESAIWTDGNVPKDRFTYNEYLKRPNIPMAVSIATVNTLGTLLCIGFLLFNIVFRNNWSIRMSSPNLNNVILIGCLGMYLLISVQTMAYMNYFKEYSFGNVCMIKTWILSIGYTLMFGGMFSKTYRVYVLFRKTMPNQKAIKDRHLFVMMGVLMLVDAAILVPWTTVFPFRVERLSKRTMDLQDANNIDYEVVMYCHNDKQVYWIIAMYVYKGLLLAFGTFLAWETRNVALEELNDSKHIASCIYTVVVVSIIGVPLQYILPVDQVHSAFMMETCMILFSTTSCACIIFVPKIRSRNKVRGQMLHKSEPGCSSRQFDESIQIQTCSM